LTSCPVCGNRILAGHVVVIPIFTHPTDFCDCGSPLRRASQQAVIYHIENQLEEEPNLSGERQA
jgi:hypothetical protein